MASITLEEAQANLRELLDRMQPGNEVTITWQNQPLARLQKSERSSGPGRAGCYQKLDFWMAADFDAPLEEFKEYME